MVNPGEAWERDGDHLEVFMVGGGWVWYRSGIHEFVATQEVWDAWAAGAKRVEKESE